MILHVKVLHCAPLLSALLTGVRALLTPGAVLITGPGLLAATLVRDIGASACTSVRNNFLLF